MPKSLKPRKSLSERKRSFVRFYAITGNATRSARLAGYRDGRGIWKTAWRLKTDAKICREVARIRETNFHGLREQITQDLQGRITTGLRQNSGYRQGAKALKLAQKLGVFEYYNTVEEEIKNMEVRFGVSFRTILATLAEIDEDPRIPAMCAEMREKYRAAETP